MKRTIGNTTREDAGVRNLLVINIDARLMTIHSAYLIHSNTFPIGVLGIYGRYANT